MAIIYPYFVQNNSSFLPKVYRFYYFEGIMLKESSYELSTELPNKEANMIAIEQNTGFTFIVEKGTKIDSTYYMPASFEFLLKTFFNILCCIFEIGDLILHHLHIDILCYLQGVFFHIDLHITEFNIGRNLHSWSNPIFWNTCSCLLFLLNFFLILYFFLFRSHPKK